VIEASIGLTFLSCRSGTFNYILRRAEENCWVVVQPS
jgi:hypothetical protein